MPREWGTDGMRHALWRSSAFRLSGLITAVLLLVVALVLGALYWSVSATLARQALAEVSREAEALSTHATVSGTRGLAGDLADRVRVLAESRVDRLYALTDADGVVLGGNLPGAAAVLPPVAPSGLFTYLPQGGAAERLAVGVRQPLAGGGSLLVAADIEEARAFAARLRLWFLVALAVIATTALVAGLAIAQAVLARIAVMREASARIMRGDLGGRIPLTGSGDELDALAASLNVMLDRIETLVDSLREVSDNIAHDLRTPLSRLRSRLEQALRLDERAPPGPGTDQDAHRAGLEAALAEADGLMRTFNALLLVAKLEAGVVDTAMEAFDARELIADVAELYEPVVEDRGLRLVVDAPEPTDAPAPIRANRQLVMQAVTNLVENAMKYGCPAPSGPCGVAAAADRGTIRLGLAQRGGAVILTVADRGPGIAPRDRARALKRFGRLDASRSQPGTGLGLSLVAAVARMHGGSVALDDNAPGLAVRVTLPTAVPGAAKVPGAGATDAEGVVESGVRVVHELMSAGAGGRQA